MKKKVCIFPYTNEEISLVVNCPEEYEIVAVVSTGTEAEESDISIFANRDKIGIKLSNDLESGIRDCDILLISDSSDKRKEMVNSQMENPLLPILYEAIEMAIYSGKEVFCFSQLDVENQKKYTEMAEKRGVSFRYFQQETLCVNNITEFVKINAPIIFIGEMVSNCDGYEIFTKLINEFKKDNIKVMAISEEKYNILYGQHSTHLMDRLKPDEMVLAINSYVVNLEKEIRPDIILVKMPQPMTSYNDVVSFDFGVSAYIISRALHADYLIYCGLFEYCTVDFVSSIAESFSYKFGIPTSIFHFSNQIEDVTDQIKERIASIHMPLLEVVKKIKEIQPMFDCSIYNLLNSENFEEFYSELKEEIFDNEYGVVL